MSIFAAMLFGQAMLLGQAAPADRKADEPAKAEQSVKLPRPRDSARPPRRPEVVPAAQRAPDPATASAPTTQKAPAPPAAETSERRRPLPAPRRENTGAGTMTRGATGADQPMNNVTPPSRNNRPVRSTDERLPTGGEPGNENSRSTPPSPRR